MNKTELEKLRDEIKELIQDYSRYSKSLTTYYSVIEDLEEILLKK